MPVVIAKTTEYTPRHPLPTGTY